MIGQVLKSALRRSWLGEPLSLSIYTCDLGVAISTPRGCSEGENEDNDYGSSSQPESCRSTIIIFIRNPFPGHEPSPSWKV